MIQKIGQTNLLIQQNVKDYNVHGPEKTEKSDHNFLSPTDSSHAFSIIKVRKLYNKLKEKGFSDAKAWRMSNAKNLPYEEQLRIKRELQKDQGYYHRSDVVNKKIISKSIINKKGYWDFVFDKQDVEDFS